MVVCGHGAGKAVRFVNAAGNFAGFLAEQAFASILERDDTDNNASSSFVIIFTKSSFQSLFIVSLLCCDHNYAVGERDISIFPIAVVSCGSSSELVVHEVRRPDIVPSAEITTVMLS